MPDDNCPNGRWSHEELRAAQATACQFLEDNSTEIAETLRAKVKFLEILIERLERRTTQFEDRLESFARVSEIAQLIEDDADGFFELASQPVVARILATVPHHR
jgi:hypothetical protein